MMKVSVVQTNKTGTYWKIFATLFTKMSFDSFIIILLWDGNNTVFLEIHDVMLQIFH